MKVLSKAMTEQVSGGCFICGNPLHNINTSFVDGFFGISIPYGIAIGIVLNISDAIQGVGDREMSISSLLRSSARLGSIIGTKIGQAMENGLNRAYTRTQDSYTQRIDESLAFV